jgi:hypothetical protein
MPGLKIAALALMFSPRLYLPVVAAVGAVALICVADSAVKSVGSAVKGHPIEGSIHTFNHA